MFEIYIYIFSPSCTFKNLKITPPIFWVILYVYVLMYVCMYVCTLRNTYECIMFEIYIYIYIFSPSCTFKNLKITPQIFWVILYVYVLMYVCMYIGKYLWVYNVWNIYIHIFSFMHFYLFSFSLVRRNKIHAYLSHKNAIISNGRTWAKL